jgi:hypothetical protein
MSKNTKKIQKLQKEFILLYSKWHDFKIQLTADDINRIDKRLERLRIEIIYLQGQ